MGNSASSGNILGYASGTQPGLVSTVAQTFAGDKTLTGLITASGGILNTGLTGANATTVTTSGSNKVGELITVTSNSFFQQLSPVSGTWYDVTGVSITIPAGVWCVSLVGTGQILTNSTVGTVGLRSALRVGTNIVSIVYAGNAAASSNIYGNCSLSFTTVTTGVTLKLSISPFATSGGYNCTEINFRSDLAETLLRACRIA